MNTIVAPVEVFLGAPLMAVLLSLATTHARLLHGLNLATMAALVVSEITLIQQVLVHGPLTTLWGLVYIDALSAFILFIVTFIGLACSLYTWTYLDDDMARGMITPKRLGLSFVLFHGFLLAMIVATTLHMGRFLTIIIANDVRSLAIVTLFLLFAAALFGGLTSRVVSMVWGTASEGVRHGEPWDIRHVPLILIGAALVEFGLVLPEPVRGLKDRAICILL